MSWFEALVLGIVQGLTEFLPVSSSGHLLIAKELFGIQTDNLVFEVLVHAATVLSVIIVFRHQILDLIKGLFKFTYNNQTKYVLFILVSMIPVFVVGVFFKDQVEMLFGGGMKQISIALYVTAILLLYATFAKPKEKPLNYSRSFLIGIAQAVAVVPGLSRSGATISTGLLCGMKKAEVTQFSFLMVLVPILGEALLELVGGDMSTASSGIATFPLIIGFLSAFVSGLFACKIMIALVKKSKLSWFALYCILVASLCLIFA